MLLYCSNNFKPTELNLLQVILGGASKMSCQMQDTTYSTIVGSLLRGQLFPMKVSNFSSFFPQINFLI